MRTTVTDPLSCRTVADPPFCHPTYIPSHELALVSITGTNTEGTSGTSLPSSSGAVASSDEGGGAGGKGGSGYAMPMTFASGISTGAGRPTTHHIITDQHTLHIITDQPHITTDQPTHHISHPHSQDLLTNYNITYTRTLLIYLITHH